jgi:hypothetical protein
MLWRLTYCQFDRHRPKLDTVHWNGTHHVGQCRSCGNAIRKSGKGYWKRLTPQESGLNP